MVEPVQKPVILTDTQQQVTPACHTPQCSTSKGHMRRCQAGLRADARPENELIQAS